VRTAVHRHANHKKQEKRKHAECSVSKMKTDERAVQNISSCFTEFNCDPFDLTNQTLWSLQSGIHASDALATDLKSAKDYGSSKVQQFRNERVYSKSKSLNDNVFRSKRKNFSTQELRTADRDNIQGKTEEMERKALAQVLNWLKPVAP